MSQSPLMLEGVDVLFPQPLLTFRFADAADFNRALLAEVAQRRQSEPGLTQNNRADCWHSAWDLFQRPEPAHQELARRMLGSVVEASRQVAPDTLRDQLDVRCEGWLMVSRRGGYTAPHHHHRSFWSGTYYVKVPPQDAPDGGAIQFLSPANALVGGRISNSPMARDNVNFTPEEGMLILFPSNLRHWVHPNASDEERVSAAFNATFMPMGPRRQS